jgi:hypothetical protein
MSGDMKTQKIDPLNGIQGARDEMAGVNHFV